MTFGHWAIDKELFDFIRQVLPDGKTILELGSGDGTAELVKHYKVYSVEHDPEWIDKYKSNYIFAPIRRHKPVKNLEGEYWYDARVLELILPEIDYDLLLIDGPPSHYGRAGLIKYWSLFKTNVIIVMDDLNRYEDWRIMVKVSGRLKKPFTVHNAWSEKKHFGVVLP